nr:hypothetical protein [Chloroflexota bacterium]
MSQAIPNKPPNCALSATWTIYRLFGVTLATDFPFANRLAPATGPVDLTFTCQLTAPLPRSLEQALASHSSSYRTDNGESVIFLYRLAECDVVRFTHIADYYLWPGRIVCHLFNPDYRYLVEIHLLGPVLSLWLELQGIPMLHAAAVAVNGHAVAFLSTNSAGKSTLAAAMVQAGYSLLTDDILPVEHCGDAFMGRPGYPQMRLWPDEAQHFLGHYEDLELVHPAYTKRRVPVGPDGFGSFCNASQPLACIYLPERHDVQEHGTRIEIVPVARRDALMELVRHSFVAFIMEQLGLQAQRLDLFAQMVQQVPMRRLVYPSGFEYLPLVREAILADVAKLP